MLTFVSFRTDLHQTSAETVSWTPTVACNVARVCSSPIPKPISLLLK